MITTFAVGAELKLIDQFSPGLRKLLTEIRQLNLALDKARESLAAIGKGVTAGLETQALAVAWREVAAASALASRKKP